MTNIITQVVAYYRVSSGAQERSGLGIEAQKEYVKTAALQQGWEIVASYEETVSGTIAPQDRPQCRLALEHKLPILVAKLDRVGRDVGHIAELMKVATVKVATMLDASAFQLHLFAALAEQERTFIANRTKEALARLTVRADGGDELSKAKIERRTQTLALGRTEANRAMANKVIQDRTAAWAASVADPIELCIRRGASTLQQVAICLNNKGITTARGGQWSSMQVSRAMSKLHLNFKETEQASSSA
jgi:DNA invertase Pin-like site-specific DNA recombinase